MIPDGEQNFRSKLQETIFQGIDQNFSKMAIPPEDMPTGTNHSSLDRAYRMSEVSSKKVPPLDM
jgi:hypothetical protein